MSAVRPCCGQTMRAPPVDAVQFVEQLPIGGTHAPRLIARLARNFGLYIPEDVLVDSVYANEPDGGPLSARNVVAVLTCRLNPRLAPHGLKIESITGVGRRLKWIDDGEVAK